ILTASFDDNKSVEYILKKDSRRSSHIRALMNYSVEVCRRFGDILLSEDKDACALVLYPDQKRTTVKSILLDIQLIVRCVGFKNIKKTLRRESLIKRVQPVAPITYVWFIGVDPQEQNKGKG